MKKICTIVLHEGVNQQEFVDSITHDNCCCIDHCEHIENVFVVHVDDAEIESLKNHQHVKDLTVEPTPHPANLNTLFSTTKTFTADWPEYGDDGRNFGPLQFYYLNDSIKSPGVTVGGHRWTATPQPDNDDVAFINGTYVSPWLGENVDIINLDVPPSSSNPLVGDHQNTHPDFRKLDDPASSKFIPTAWTGLNDALNTQQLTTSTILTRHAAGVLSVSAGTYCGYAKKSNLRCLYFDTNGIVSTINRVISWHNAKPINPLTGEKNPTILLHEYQFLASNLFAIKIDDILSISYYDTATSTTITVNRPGTSWGNNLTPFISNNFNIKRTILNGAYYWTVSVPPSSFTGLFAAINSAHNAGIINVVPAGNDCGVYVKQNDPNYNVANIKARAGAQVIYYNLDGQFKIQPSVFTTLTTATNYSVGKPYGPHGVGVAIDVAAGQNSETYPILDHYSTRGPGVDIVGLGSKTWSSSPSIAFADGNKWGFFSGTSCAAPVVAGILACLLEKYRYYYGNWPTPTQAKELLLIEAKKNILSSVTATTWASVPHPSTIIRGTQLVPGPYDLMLVNNNVFANGGISQNELVGTPNRRAFIDNSVAKHNLNRSSRPASGMVYPRNKIRIN